MVELVLGFFRLPHSDPPRFSCGLHTPARGGYRQPFAAPSRAERIDSVAHVGFPFSGSGCENSQLLEFITWQDPRFKMNGSPTGGRQGFRIPLSPLQAVASAQLHLHCTIVLVAPGGKKPWLATRCPETIC